MTPAKLGSPAHPTAAAPSLAVPPNGVEVPGCSQAGASPDGCKHHQSCSQQWVKHDQRLKTVIECYDAYDDVFHYLKVIGCLMG